MSKSSITTDGVPTPNRVTTHPGEVLGEEFLKPPGPSVNALAIALRNHRTRLGANLSTSLRALAIAVGTLIAERPPHRTVQAAFPHTAPTLGA
jgi:hypothetical protein